MPIRCYQATRLAAVLTAALFGVCACAQNTRAGGGPIPGVVGHSRASTSSGQYIDHIVVMVQENRSFDNFFSTFPGADGATQGLMETSTGDVYVQLQKSGLHMDNLTHEHSSFEIEFDHGKMDGFDFVQRELPKGVRIPAGTYPYRYVDPKQIAPYWTIAQQYVLGDQMFTTQSSSSFTAHQDLIAGGTPIGADNVIDFPDPPTWGCDAPPGTVTSLITPHGIYKHDVGPFPCFTYRTLRDLLDANRRSWLYFTSTSVSYVWNAFDAIKAVRDGPEWKSNIVIPQTKIYQYITNQQLPAVSWIIPDAADSDHPGIRSDTGPSWIASVVNAIGESAYWPSTAIIVVWDDWGGEYDNVKPPQIGGQGLGMRVPMLVVSAYARETVPGVPGYISHTQYNFGSIVRFIEDNWQLGRLGTSDVWSNSIVDCFDFTQSPRQFVPIPGKYKASYFIRRPPSGLPLDDQ